MYACIAYYTHVNPAYVFYFIVFFCTCIFLMLSNSIIGSDYFKILMQFDLIVLQQQKYKIELFIVWNSYYISIIKLMKTDSHKIVINMKINSLLKIDFKGVLKELVRETSPLLMAYDDENLWNKLMQDS